MHAHIFIIYISSKSGVYTLIYVWFLPSFVLDTCRYVATLWFALCFQQFTVFGNPPCAFCWLSVFYSFSTAGNMYIYIYIYMYYVYVCVYIYIYIYIYILVVWIVAPIRCPRSNCKGVPRCSTVPASRRVSIMRVGIAHVHRCSQYDIFLVRS